MRQQSVLHFNYLPQQAMWINRLMTGLGQNASPVAQEMLHGWRAELGEVAGAIATKTRIVTVITQRVDSGLARLAEELVSDKANVEECMRVGAAYRLPDELPFALVADLDSFLFETRSTYELMVKFIWLFLRQLRSPRASSKPHHLHAVIEAEIAARDGQTAWIEDLRTHRHLFAHETAGWPALLVMSLEPLNVEVVILKRNVTLLDDPSKLCRAAHLPRNLCRFLCGICPH